MTTHRVLIVEDDPDGQALVSHVVEHLNFPFDVVDNAEQATEKLFVSDSEYGAVIIDLHLPGQDGFDLLASIREYATGSLICIAVTAYHTSQTRLNALDAGFNAYFSKPLDAMHFADELKSML